MLSFQGWGQSISLVTGFPTPFKNCGFVEFSANRGAYTSATLYILEWSVDNIVPYTSVGTYLVSSKAPATNTGYYRIQFSNSTGIIGTPVYYANYIEINPDPIISTSLTFGTSSFEIVYGNSTNLTANTSPKISNSWTSSSSTNLSLLDNGSNVDLNAIQVGGPTTFTYTDINGCRSTIDITVNAATLTVTASNQSKLYGATSPLTGTLNTNYTVTGLLNTDAASGVALSYSGSPSGNLATASVGTYSITTSGLTLSTGSLSNYTIGYVSGTLTINAATLTVTASNQSKLYGATSPLTGTLNTNYTVTGLLNTDAASGVALSYSGSPSGNLATASVGTYSITTSGLTLSTGSLSNYTIGYVSGTLTINAATLTVTADAKNKSYDGSVYGGGYTSTITGYVNSEGISVVTGTPTYSGTSQLAVNAGAYVITPVVTGLSATNYTFTSANGTLTIGKVALTVTATAGQTKVYGGVDPTSYAYTLSPALVGSDILTGALTRVSGETVGTYAIGQGTLANANYDITYVGSDFTITKKAITVTATAGQTKVYGAADPVSYVYTLSPALVGSDVLTGALTRAAGETVGVYAITQGTLTNANYDITYVGSNFTITKKAITVTATAGQTKIYGAADPASYVYTLSPALIGSDVLTGALTRAVGETVGAYLITQGTLTNANYDITYVGSNFTITKKAITVTATAGQTKVYGAADPTSYVYTLSPALVGSDVLTGALKRAAGESVGIYAITQGTLTNANYDITYVGSNFTITKKAITVTATAGQTKIYGAADPASYAYTLSPALLGSDILTGALTRAAGETVGAYAITQGTLANANYDITYVGSNFTITKKAITVTATAGQTKIYGAADPTSYAYTLSPALIGSDVLTGALTRAIGETVGTYAIGQGTLANANYDITYVGSDFTITKKAITVTATAGQTKVYGAADPTSYLYTLSPALVGSDVLTGALTRVSGETVGTYAIGQGTLTNANYDISYVGSNFTITKKAITVTATAGQTKVYGAADPVSYVYTLSPALLGSDILTGALTRAAGETVGAYVITQGTLANANYDITYVGSDFTITKKAITVTATAGQTKVYGATDPASYVYTLSPVLIGSDILTGALTRAAGETVGAYVITQGTLANANYDITYVGSDFTITKKAITVTATAGQTKVYGATDPASYVYTLSPVLIGSDILTGALTRAAGETVGAYAITQGTLTNANYDITYVGSNFTITKKAITLTATAGQTKVYGAADPTSYVYTLSPALVGSDVLTGVLTRAAGETVGTYAITQGTLTNANYDITYVGSDFTITKKAITVTATAGQTKIYGAADPTSYVYTLSPALVGSDILTGALTRVSGETVGTYAIGQGTLANANYDITYVGNNFTITKKAITVTATAGQTKVYGATDPASYVYTLSPVLIGSDILTGALTRAAGETVGAYAITQGTLTNANYDITYVGSNFIITQKALTITADNKSKVYGTANPTLTYTYNGLANGDVATSTPPSITTTAVVSSPVGTYSITISGASDANYSISYVNGTLSVIKATLTIIADNQTKVEGSPNPTFTISYSGFISGESPSNLTTIPTATCAANNNSPAGTYPITLSGATAANYTIIYQNGTLTITAPLIMKFEIPNAFIPTDMYMDNKFLKAAYNSSVKRVNYFRVFNRMGKLVYEIQNADPSAIKWDGTFNNVMQEPDGYMWIAEITGLGEVTFERKSGQFLLIK